MVDEAKNQTKVAAAIARAQSMTPEKRRSIATKAAKARWGLKATHRGNFQEELGLDVDCFVLDDDQKTAVVSQRGMAAALGMSDGGSRLPRFIGAKSIADYVGPELREKLDNPIVFQSPGAGPNPTVQVHGYDVGVLIDLCKAILAADRDGNLRQSQKPVAKQASIIQGASAKLGIQRLVYTLAGYDASREETIRAFKIYVAEEARDYEKEFPDQLYVEWYRLYALPVHERGNPWKFKHLTVNHVYQPLAKSRGRILEMTRLHKAKSLDRRKKLHQFLSEIGVKALRQHLGQLLGIAQISDNQDTYERHVKKVFGDQHELSV